MPSPTFKVIHTPPDKDDFIALRVAVGWQSIAPALVRRSMANTLHWSIIMRDEKLVAMGRVIGDSAMYFYVQDVVVHPDYQGQKLGRLIMEDIEKYLLSTCLPGATIGLMAAPGKTAFYEKFGYSARDGKAFGFGMCKFIDD
ncbi:GNAT family N-acetyltransferase [Alteromonas pelagimontana]|uniref:GNAT family N-acetyltransferase n=1 Tax=Alteromonas pelagimontana TaxID=1858656 RepID=A0A6M4MDP9_9ALTE|nr:GNAT family N-acetyltransferase [Alteromonas pelagimontana]QJR81232.1 GNAT family N-acetyltransferase [Alteromonas pelagimontana]